MKFSDGQSEFSQVFNFAILCILQKIGVLQYRSENKLTIQTIQKLNTTQKKQTTQNTAKQNNPDSVASYDTRPGNEVAGGLIL